MKTESAYTKKRLKVGKFDTPSKDCPCDMRFLQSTLKSAYDVQHDDAKMLAESCTTSLISRLTKSGLADLRGLNLLESTSGKAFIDSDVKYSHIQTLFELDTKEAFTWNAKRAEEETQGREIIVFVLWVRQGSKMHSFCRGRGTIHHHNIWLSRVC